MPYKKREDRRLKERRYKQTANGKAVAKASADKRKNTTDGKARSMLATIKHRAKVRGIAYDLDTEWLGDKFVNGCELTGIAFTFFDHVGGIKTKSGHPMGPSVDKIDSTKGYTKSNCQVILLCLNAFKSTMSNAQMLIVAQKLIGVSGSPSTK